MHIYMPIGGTFLKANVPCTDLSEDLLINDLLSVVSLGFPLSHYTCLMHNNYDQLSRVVSTTKFVVIYGMYIYSMPIEL